MATQVKHRRGTSAEIATRTPAAGEIWVNTDDSSIHVGDGSTLGGTKHVTTASLGSYMVGSNNLSEITNAATARSNLGVVPSQRDNLIVDGGFLVWDEGTSQTSSGYGSDTMWLNQHNGSSKTHTRQAFTIGQSDVPGNPLYFSRTSVASSAGSNNFVVKDQRMEDVTRLAGETVTLSFYAKADSSKDIATEFFQSFGIGGSATVNGIGVTTHNLTTSWQRFTSTFTIPSVSGKTLGTSLVYLNLRFWFDSGSNFNASNNSLGHQSGDFDIANVKLEVGDTATDFGVLDVDATQKQVARYFERIVSSNSFTAVISSGFAKTGSYGLGILRFAPKIATPSVSFSAMI